MIRIEATNGRITVEGHAEYAPHGQDIVCAAISALIQTLTINEEGIICKGSFRMDAIEGTNVEINTAKFPSVGEECKIIINNEIEFTGILTNEVIEGLDCLKLNIEKDDGSKLTCIIAENYENSGMSIIVFLSIREPGGKVVPGVVDFVILKGGQNEIIKDIKKIPSEFLEVPIPNFTATENGKVLGVVDGTLAWVSPSTLFTDGDEVSY